MSSKRPPASLEEKPLPDAIDIERLVLGAAIAYAENLQIVTENLTDEDFHLQKHKVIFNRIYSLVRLGVSPVDRIVLAESLIANSQLETVDGLSYIVSLDEGLPQVHNLKNYVQILKDKTRLRKLIFLGQELINEGMDPSANADDITSALDRKIYTTFAISTRSSIEKLSGFIDRTPFSVLMNQKKDSVGIYTGYRHLDALTDGLHEGEIMLFGAATSVGKSSVAIQIAMHNATRGIPVVIYSPEMNKKALYDRFVCQHAGVPVIRFKSNDLNSEERARVSGSHSYIYELPIYIDDGATLKPSEVMMRNRRAKEYFGARLSIIDYLQKMRADFSRGNALDKLTEICDAMVVIAKETIPIVVLSQLSREHRKNKEKPSLDDLKGGGVIGEMAQVAALIHRPEMDKGSSDPSLRGKAEFLLGKNRSGRISEIQMKYIGWRMMFEDLECNRKECRVCYPK